MGPEKQQHIYYIALGSNLGRPAENLAAAIAQMATRAVLPVRLSPVYRTAPVGYTDQPDFLNCAIAVRTSRTPRRLLDLLQAIEAMLGRRRPFPNAPRTIDIDILLCEDIIVNTHELMIPHPRMRSRQFVLIPLYDIAPDLLMPDGTPLSSMVNRSTQDITRLGRLAEIVDTLNRPGGL